MTDYIIQISDIHLLNNENLLMFGRSPAKQLQLALNDIEKKFKQKKTIILSGDLVKDANRECYESLAGYFNALSSPVYALPGNHDNASYLKSYFNGKNIFKDNLIQLGKWLVVLLDSSTPGKNLGSGKIADKELANLDEVLKKNSDKHIIIFIHHPPLMFGAKWFQKICLENGDDFMALIKNHNNVKCVSFGHAHSQEEFIIDKKLFCCVPSSWIQYDHSIDDRAVHSDLPGGYRWFCLRDEGTIQFGTHYFAV